MSTFSTKKSSDNTGQERRFSSSRILLSTTDLKGKITYANDDFCNISGYSRDELYGHEHNMVRHNEMPETAFTDLWSTIKAGKAWMGPVKNRCKNGDHYWVNAYITPLKDKNGKTSEYQSVTIAIDEKTKQRAEETYQQINVNKAPVVLKFTNLDITQYVQNLLLFIAVFVAASAFTTSTPLFVSLPLLLLTLGTWLIFSRWRNHYKKILSTGNGVFNNPLMGYLYTGTPDKVGQLALALTMRQAELNAVISRVSDLSGNINAIAQDTAESDDKIAQMLDQQHQEVEQVAAAISQMSTSIAEVNGSVSGASKSSLQGKNLSGDGVKAVSETVESVLSLSAQLGNVETVIAKLADGRHDIAAISDEISSIADQTNLLALNAAIEAARAGEQGRGFAVVAEEVRALAQRTQLSTEEISKTLSSLNQESLQAVAAINDGVMLVEKCVDFANNTGANLHSINEEVDKIAAINYQVAASVAEQSVVTEQISNNTNSIKEIASLGVQQGRETKQLSKSLLTELTTLKNLIRQFDT